MEILLTPIDVKVMILALQDTIESMEHGLKQPEFNEHAKYCMTDITAAATAALDKLTKASGFACIARPYQPGDETEFIIKQS